ncbi:MAG: Lrp/AsnC family transcriptional regulator [Candidatus Anstonellaceae archaeon]
MYNKNGVVSDEIANFKLDKIDKAILYYLSFNSRIKFSKLAKLLKTSPARIVYHYNNLLKNNIILYFLTLVDYRKLGYNTYSIYYRVNDISKKKREEIIKEISKISNVADIIEIDGIYNFHVAILEKNLLNAATSVWKIREILSPVLIEELILIYLHAETFERKMFKEKNWQVAQQKTIIVQEPSEIIKLNPKEQKILSILANNANLSIVELAKKTSLSPSFVHSTIKNLEKKKVIKGYTIKINPELFGYLYYRVLVRLKHISTKKRQEIINFLEKHDSIYRSTITFGMYDLVYDVRVSSLANLKELIQQIYEKYQNEIIRQDWIKIYKIIKYTFYNDEGS